MKFILLLTLVTAIGFQAGIDFLMIAVPLSVIFSVVNYKRMQ
jgi:hypothetical protein